MKHITNEIFQAIISGRDFINSNLYKENIIVFDDRVTLIDIAAVDVRIDKDSVVTREIHIESGLFGLEIVEGIIPKTLRIKGGTFRHFTLDRPKFEKDGILSIEGGVFQERVEINDGEFDRDCYIWNGQFNNGFGITGGLFKGNFMFHGGTFSRSVDIGGCKIIKELYIHKTTFEYDLLITSGQFRHIRVWECPGLKRLMLSGKELYINQLDLQPTSPLTIYGFEFTIDHLNLGNCTFNKDVNLILHDIKVYVINMHRLYNFGYICLKGIEPMTSPRSRLRANFPDKPTIVFRDSNLGKIDFMGCDLTKFTIEFENSRITDALVLGGKFSADIILPKDSTENIDEQKRLFMGQLKKVFEGKGDTLTSTYFHSEDMNAYNHSLLWNKNLLASSNFEKINLRLNWISSNHGYSVRRASMSTVAVILIGYFLYCIALGVYPSLEKGSWREFGIVMSFAFEFMNPVHKSGIIPEGLGILKNDNGWARSIEGLSRLVITYFIYQFIQAFRKHGKKSSS